MEIVHFLIPEGIKIPLTPRIRLIIRLRLATPIAPYALPSERIDRFMGGIGYGHLWT